MGKEIAHRSGGVCAAIDNFERRRGCARRSQTRGKCGGAGIQRIFFW